MDPDLGDLVSRVLTSGLMLLGLSGQRRRLQGEEEGGAWGGCDFGEEEEASLVLFGARC